MKNILILLALTVSLLCGCQKNTENTPSDETASGGSGSAAAEDTEPFSPYTAAVSDRDKNKYIITLSEGERGVLVTVEDKNFNASSYIISPPEGFSPNYRDASASIDGLCRIISNDIDPSVSVPDIICINFSNDDNAVCQFYAIDSGKLVKIGITEGGSGEQLPYIPKTALYHSEPLKFISSIIVDESAGLSADISQSVKIYTYAFDPEAFTLTGGYEKLSENNPLYFCYAYWGLANNTAEYFLKGNLELTAGETEEMPSENGSENVYFAKVNDPRFSTMEELIDYLKQLFPKMRLLLLLNQQVRKTLLPIRDSQGTLI